uniref:Uncharacterized protein n=1 Tax=Ananas comosus var. bracteatus TaxID=296719 RepID=A0A6V7Q9U4_ANACO|nr:unnamed protein product [Ananas comosus var. bracteatus]
MRLSLGDPVGPQSRTDEHMSHRPTLECRLVGSDPHKHVQMSTNGKQARPTSALPCPCVRPDLRRAAPAAGKPTRIFLSCPLCHPLLPLPPSHHSWPKVAGKLLNPSGSIPLAETPLWRRHRPFPPSAYAAGAAPAPCGHLRSPRPSLGDLCLCKPPPFPIGSAALRRPPATSHEPPRRPGAPPAAARAICGRPERVRVKLGPVLFSSAAAAYRRAHHQSLSLQRRIAVAPSSSDRRLTAADPWNSRAVGGLDLCRRATGCRLPPA